MRVLTLLVFVVAAVVFAGCGGGGQENSGSEETRYVTQMVTVSEPEATKETDPNAEETMMIEKTDLPGAPAALKPYVLSGTGQAVTESFNLTPGLRTFEVEYGGGPSIENFTVELLNRDGTGLASNLLFNKVVEAGSGFTGSQAAQIQRPGVYVLQVKAIGPWQVTIR